MSLQHILSQLKNSLPQHTVDEVVCHEQTTLIVDKNGLKPVLSFLKESGFEVLMDLTGVDYLKPTERTKVVYWLHNPMNLERVRVSIFAARNELIPSVVTIWEGADWYERELYDLFGVRFEGHPDLKRILMPDDWVGHPLRKDYSLNDIPVQFKHGVKPKAPSQIIPAGKFSTCQE